MDLDIIREFTLLAETCNFQVAAEHLSLSQSALSKHIHKLEEELSMDLFDRSKRSVSLNENGEAFLEYARRICKLCDECNGAMSRLRTRKSDALNIGLLRTYDQSDLIEKLTQFCNETSDIQITMQEYQNEQIKAKLTSGECDFAFTSNAGEFVDDEFEKVVYKNDRLVLLLPDSHPLADKQSIDLSEIASEKFIEHSAGFEQKLIQDILDSNGLNISISARVSYINTVFRMVAQKMGIAIVSEGCTGKYQDYNLVKADLTPKTDFSVYLIYRKRKLSEAGREFIDFFTSTQ